MPRILTLKPETLHTTDGGVTVDNIASIAEAGVDMFVAGSAILKAPRTQEVQILNPELRRYRP
jgi:pentose-5-phosphate-3-epimerase